jgi:hypothetical protein
MRSGLGAIRTRDLLLRRTGGAPTRANNRQPSEENQRLSESSTYQ